MIFVLIMLVPVVICAMIAADETRKGKRGYYLENLKVCRAAHRPFKPCMEGCEHAEPHICEGNECLEHKAAECVSAYLYGYRVTDKEYATLNDSLPDRVEGKE